MTKYYMKVVDAWRWGVEGSKSTESLVKLCTVQVRGDFFDASERDLTGQSFELSV